MKRYLLFILLLLVALPSQAQSRKVYYNAFSHNDYEHSRPLFDALDRGFNCVEADLWYIDGELMWESSDGGVCNQPGYLKLTLEVGSWAGEINKSDLPAAVYVDYVRVYQFDELT